MDDNDKIMSQLAQLQNRGAGVGGVETPPPVQQTQPQHTPMKSRQQEMREQMNANRNITQGSPTVMTQGENYNPTNTSPLGTSTVINTTKKDTVTQPAKKEKSDDAGGGLLNGKSKMIFIGIGIVIIVIIFIGSFFKRGGTPAVEPTPTIEPTPTEALEWIIPEPETWHYQPVDAARLRAAGYTSYEIEQHELTQTNVDYLIKQAEEARQAWLDETMKPLYDGRSEEFKKLENETWLGQEVMDEAVWKSAGILYTNRKNLDYEKIEPRGHQLWLKIYLNKEGTDWFYHLCNAEDWSKLDDAGNVVVSYTYNKSYDVEDGMVIVKSSLEIIQ